MAIRGRERRAQFLVDRKALVPGCSGTDRFAEEGGKVEEMVSRELIACGQFKELVDPNGPRKMERRKMGQTMQDLKKKVENEGKDQSENVKEQAQEKGPDMAKEKSEEVRKKMGI